VKWVMALTAVFGCAYCVGPLRRGVRVDVVNSTLHRELGISLRRAVTKALTQRGLSTADGPVATITITTVKGSPTFEIARTLITGEVTVTAIVRLQKRQKKFSATRPFNGPQTEEAEKDAISELADEIADWLATTS